MVFANANRNGSLKHTPTPWKGAEVSLGGGPDGEWEDEPAMMVWPASQNSLEAHVAGTIIAEFYDVGDPDDGGQEAHTNAKFAVHACNLHDELLAALKLLVADVAGYEAWQRPCHAVDVAEAVIAKAEGR